MDIVVEQAPILEIKAVAQLLSYLRLSGIPLGLRINFNEVHLKERIRRRRL